MQRQIMATRWIVLLAVLLLPLVLQGAALGQSVVINGIPLITSRTPVTMSGTMLLPMRDVFEALESEVKWFASEQKVMAVRGQTTVELWLGRTTATINGIPMQLPVPPQLLNGSTYVPLRFPAEAFGGSVEWQAATRTALITIPPVGQSTTPTTPPTPPEPPTTTVQPTLVEGTLVQVIAQPASIIITVSGTGLAQAISLGPNTALTRHADGQNAQPAMLSEAQAGDYAQATLAPTGVALSVDLTYGEAQGMVAGISENSVLLKDNQLFQLSPTVKVVDQNNKTVALSNIPAGTPVLLRYQPSSRIVWSISATLGTQTPPAQPGKPQIIVVGLLNDSPLLKAGDILQAQIQGTPGGVATVSLGNIFRNLAMAEVDNGIYQAEFMVPPNLNAANLTLTGNLTVNNVRATPVISPVRLTIDSTPPTITDMAPAQGEVVRTTDTAIEAMFQAGTGTPINPASATMEINGLAVEGATATADKITFQARNLPRRALTVRVTVADMAGNTAEQTWTFTVGVGNTMLFALSHDAQGVLGLDDVLTVTLRTAAPGGRATFDIGNLRKNLPMQQVDAGDTYQGSYTVQAGDRADNAVVTVHYWSPAGPGASAHIANKVDIDAGLPNALTITHPADNTKVADTIIVRGQAEPASRVRVTISYRTLAVVVGQLWQGTVITPPNGLWVTQAVTSSTGVLGKADEYTIKAEQLDAGNNVVATEEIKLHK